MARRLLRAASALGLLLAAACQRDVAASVRSSAPAATVDRYVEEETLTSVRLTQREEQRLGIEAVPVALEQLPRVRTLGGELTLSLGRPTTALAQLAELQLSADAAFEAARLNRNAVKDSSSRARALLDVRSGSERAVEEARAQLALAEAALESARKRRDLLGRPVLEAVEHGALWVRVPVYAGDLARIDLEVQATVRRFGTPIDSPGHPAQRVQVPLAPAPNSASVDLFYEISGPKDAFLPGERVSVSLLLAEPSEALVVAQSAIVHDIHGDTWVYERTGPGLFARRRVQVRYAIAGKAALATGPEPGAQVVTAGAAELFGTELGFAK